MLVNLSRGCSGSGMFAMNNVSQAIVRNIVFRFRNRVDSSCKYDYQVGTII